MLLRARDIRVGHFIMHYGVVQKVHVLNNAVAATKATHSEMPKRKGKKLRGRVLMARLEQEAEEQCYDQVPGSIVFSFASGKSLSRRPDDQVLVVSVWQSKTQADVAVVAKVHPRPAA